MTTVVRSLAIGSAIATLAGFLTYAVLGDGSEASTPAEDVGIGLSGLGFGGFTLALAIRLWHSPRQPVRIAAVAPSLLAALFFAGAVGGFGDAIRGKADDKPNAPAKSAAATPPASPSQATSETASVAATATPTPPTPAITAPTSETPAPLPSVTPIPPSGAAEISDPTGDTLDEDDNPAPGPAHIDIERVTVEAKDGRIEVSLYAAAAPPSVDPRTHEIAYGWWIETTGDAVPDWHVLVQNSEDSDVNVPGWVAGILDFKSGQAREGRDFFPGTAVVEGNWISVRLPLDAIGSPTVIKVAGFTEDTVWPDVDNDPFTTILRQDLAPDGQWPGGTDWMMVRIP